MLKFVAKIPKKATKTCGFRKVVIFFYLNCVVLDLYGFNFLNSEL